MIKKLSVFIGLAFGLPLIIYFMVINITFFFIIIGSILLIFWLVICYEFVFKIIFTPERKSWAASEHERRFPESISPDHLPKVKAPPPPPIPPVERGF